MLIRQILLPKAGLSFLPILWWWLTRTMLVRVNVHATKDFDLSEGTSQPLSQPLSQSLEEKIIEFCKEPRSGAEIAAYCGFKDVKNFREHYLNPLLGTRIKMTIPDKPTSRFQKYISY